MRIPPEKLNLLLCAAIAIAAQTVCGQADSAFIEHIGKLADSHVEVQRLKTTKKIERRVYEITTNAWSTKPNARTFLQKPSTNRWHVASAAYHRELETYEERLGAFHSKWTWFDFTNALAQAIASAGGYSVFAGTLHVFRDGAVGFKASGRRLFDDERMESVRLLSDDLVRVDRVE